MTYTKTIFLLPKQQQYFALLLLLSDCVCLSLCVCVSACVCLCAACCCGAVLVLTGVDDSPSAPAWSGPRTPPPAPPLPLRPPLPPRPPPREPPWCSQSLCPRPCDWRGRQGDILSERTRDGVRKREGESKMEQNSGRDGGLERIGERWWVREREGAKWS